MEPLDIGSELYDSQGSKWKVVDVAGVQDNIVSGPGDAIQISNHVYVLEAQDRMRTSCYDYEIHELEPDEHTKFWREPPMP